jgi:hypothetical protein
MLSDELIHSMFSDYEGGLSLSEVGRRHGRNRKSIPEVFLKRGIALRPCPHRQLATDPRTGCFLPKKRHTKRQIDAYVNTLDSVRIPDGLRWEWRLWPMPRRLDFIARVRARLDNPYERPSGPFSHNVIPWAYGHPLAMKLAYQDSSQKSKSKVKLTSQGVIWQGKLFYWSGKTGSYTEGCGWTPEYGRPQLHHVIWEKHNGRPVPPKYTVIFRDGNKNNLTPRNLALRSMNECARINQAAWLNKRSRESTALLLRQHQKGKTHEHNMFDQIAQAGRKAGRYSTPTGIHPRRR